MDTLRVGVWIADNKGKIIKGNAAGQLVWRGAKYVGVEEYGEYKGWWANTGKRIEVEDWALARTVIKGKTSLNEMIEIECFDGSRKMILNSAVPVRNASGFLDRIFKPFPEAARSKQYEGMDLAIVHKIVERHSGSITAKSTPGRIDLHVTLPVKQNVSDGDQPIAARP